MKKQTIKINENQLRKMVRKMLKESFGAEGNEIFTLDILDVENDEGMEDIQYARDYSSEEEAINAAREVARKYADYDSVINVFVMAGEHMDQQGNVLGNPEAIYCISNKDKETTMMARQNAGFTAPEVDEYADNSQGIGGLNESKLRKLVRESVNKMIKEGTTDRAVMDAWGEAEEIMGASEMLNALYNYLDCDTIEGFVNTLRREYELPLGGSSWDEEDEDYLN